MVGLLYAMLDYTRDAETFEAYDRMSAHQLFIKMGISKRLVDDFIRPTLLVGLFKPPEELSAAVAMELLYYYALAHQTSFDVRWIRSKSISELIVAPMAERLAAATLPPAAAAAAGAAGEPALAVSGGGFVQRLGHHPMLPRDEAGGPSTACPTLAPSASATCRMVRDRFIDACFFC